MKKHILGIALSAAVAAPVVASVSCSWIDDKSVNHYRLMPTYTGEADQLIALGIKPDYYPLQLDAKKPYDYLTNPSEFLSMQNPQFRDAFASKISSLMSGVTKGTSWWNQQALDAGEKGSDPSYWQRQSADVLLYEHYLLDDDAKVIDSAIAPKHDEDSTIQTNFRWSRDPFTRLSKGVIFCLDKVDMEIVDGKLIWKWQNNQKPTPWMQTINGDSYPVSQEDINTIEKFMADNVDAKGEGSWIYNSKFFAWIFHSMYLDNDDFETSPFKDWIVDTSKEPAFDLNLATNEHLQNLFAVSTYTQEEKDAGIKLPKYQYTAPIGQTHAHHPIYEQQEGEVGAAPMFEGSMRDNMLYLFNVSYQVSNLANFGNVYGKEAYNKATPETKAKYDAVKERLSKVLTKEQFEGMKAAFENAKSITSDLKARMKAMKDYFKELGANDKTFGLVTIAPGAGQSTIQSMSKYSFLYRELGFNQPLPNNLEKMGNEAKRYLDDSNNPNPAAEDGALFNMDDNGWWWNLGNNTESITKSLGQFTDNGKGNIDIAVITARESDYNDIITNQQPVRASLARAIGSNTQTSELPSMRVNYDLWNEGIKTPFVFHMVLDQVLQQTENWARKNGTFKDDASKREAALNWGNYFTKTFIS